ncbi:hypothetical protein [Neorhodopirellula lusitana]|uniref:hypothetical protein n=1 Tax=Neorhodopirellula lusitana TaxID=445327 RepID=UPI00384C11AD
MTGEFAAIFAVVYDRDSLAERHLADELLRVVAKWLATFRCVVSVEPSADGYLQILN